MKIQSRRSRRPTGDGHAATFPTAMLVFYHAKAPDAIIDFFFYYVFYRFSMIIGAILWMSSAAQLLALLAGSLIMYKNAPCRP